MLNLGGDLYWIGQKFCLGFSLKMLQKNQNKLFGQPNRFEYLLCYLLTVQLWTLASSLWASCLLLLGLMLMRPRPSKACDFLACPKGPGQWLNLTVTKGSLWPSELLNVPCLVKQHGLEFRTLTKEGEIDTEIRQCILRIENVHVIHLWLWFLLIPCTFVQGIWNYDLDLIFSVSHSVVSDSSRLHGP